jgi:hypothetical protein
MPAVPGAGEQVAGGVEAGGAGADHGDAKGLDGVGGVGHRREWGWARPDSNGRPPRCKRGALAS